MKQEVIKTSPLGFGCASVMGKVGRSQSLRAMGEAFEQGVTHFDIARSYGFGRAESVLGHFIQGKRDQVTITSKFGVVPPKLSIKTRVLIPIARTLTRLVPQLKSKLKGKSGQLLAEKRFDVAFAGQCLDDSLRELKTDYIDFYMLHEPDLAQGVLSDELTHFFENARSIGKIRQWGVAYRSPQDYPAMPLLAAGAIQFEGSLVTFSELPAELRTDIRKKFVMRPFGGGFHEVGNQDFLMTPNVLAEMKGIRLTPSEMSLSLAKRLAGGDGTVVCSMFSPEHIRSNVRVISELPERPEMIHLIDRMIAGI